MKWLGIDIDLVELMKDGTVKVRFPDGREEIWGWWKGKWFIEGEENGNG